MCIYILLFIKYLDINNWIIGNDIIHNDTSLKFDFVEKNRLLQLFLQVKHLKVSPKPLYNIQRDFYVGSQMALFPFMRNKKEGNTTIDRCTSHLHLQPKVAFLNTTFFLFLKCIKPHALWLRLVIANI